MSLEFSKAEAYYCIDEAVTRLKKQIELWSGETVVLDEDRPVLRHVFGTSRERVIADVSVKVIP